MKDSKFHIFCYWCLADERNTDPPIIFTYPALIYPLCQWYLHEKHSRGMHFLYFQNIIAENNAADLISEVSMLQSRFFQTRTHFDSFEFIDESGYLNENTEFKDYLKPYNPLAKRLIWNSWGIIERDLRWAILDQDEPLEKDYNTVFGISKEYH
ncbi:MAG TPA: hypothetical protein VK590_15750 [Saprospiraceae bacterium]|nr:hypothetical protein [Saprospiraceae bacterium]